MSIATSTTPEAATHEPEPADPLAQFSGEFQSEIRRAQAGIIAGAQALDPTFAIAHAKALRSALYRAEQDAKRLW